MMNKRSLFKNCKNYSLYYGVNNCECLSKYNIAIVEPQGQNEESINIMHAEGTLVIAYVSVIEIFEGLSNYKFLREDDFLKIGNKRITNETFNTFLADLRSKRWNSILQHHIGDLILNRNYDGIFLDTIGDIEFPIFNQQLRDQLICEAVNLIIKIRQLYDDIIIIQNNGLNKLVDNTSKYIDGVCWENAMFGSLDDSDWFEYITHKLKKMWNNEQVKVLLLYEEKNINMELQEYNSVSYAEKLAEKNGFLLYKTYSYC